MYVNSGYLNNSLVDFMDKSKPLIVGSCGTYQIRTKPKFPTYRPKGRLDYQLIYVAAGKGYFYFNNEDEAEVVTPGHMVLFRPKEVQKYEYYCADQTEVFWVHFTGSDVKKLLAESDIPSFGHVFYAGQLPEYRQIFSKIIEELQVCKNHYSEMLNLLLRQLFILLGRQFIDHKKINRYAQNEIDIALKYFNEHYNHDISIEEYAESRHMSTCWFIRNFKLYTEVTPMQYILAARIANAQNLLDKTALNITEISNIVGYENPLYFSRLFKKQTGMSPSEYRKADKK